MALSTPTGRLSSSRFSIFPRGVAELSTLAKLRTVKNTSYYINTQEVNPWILQQVNSLGHRRTTNIMYRTYVRLASMRESGSCKRLLFESHSFRNVPLSVGRKTSCLNVSSRLYDSLRLLSRREPNLGGRWVSMLPFTSSVLKRSDIGTRTGGTKNVGYVLISSPSARTRQVRKFKSIVYSLLAHKSNASYYFQSMVSGLPGALHVDFHRGSRPAMSSYASTLIEILCLALLRGSNSEL